MANLGELLLAEGLISPEQLDQGLRAKAVYGGRVGTNLVELGYIDDVTLHRILAHQLGVSALPLDAQPSPEALRCLTPALCAELNVLPVRVKDDRLIVATLDPGNAALIAQLRQLVGREVEALVASEGRLYALLYAVLGIERPLRYAVVEAEALRASQGRSGPPTMRGILHETAFSTAPADSVGAEEDGLEEILLLDVVDDGGLDDDLEFDVDVEDFTGPDSSSRVFDFPITTSELEIQPAEDVGPDPFVREAHETLSEEDQRPLSYTEALVEIQNCSDREQLARVLLRYAISMYRRALIFSVQRRLVLGWDGMGDRVDQSLAQKLMISLNVPSLFGRVCEQRKPYQGPLDDSPLMRLFVKIMGGTWPTSCHLVPFVVGERVVAVLYSDNELREITAARASELTIVMIQVRRAFARFMAQVDASQP